MCWLLSTFHLCSHIISLSSAFFQDAAMLYLFMFPLYFHCHCFIPGLSLSWVYLSCSLSKMLPPPAERTKSDGFADWCATPLLQPLSWVFLVKKAPPAQLWQGKPSRWGWSGLDQAAVSFGVWGQHYSTHRAAMFMGGETSAFPPISSLPFTVVRLSGHFLCPLCHSFSWLTSLLVSQPCCLRAFHNTLSCDLQRVKPFLPTPSLWLPGSSAGT